MSSSPSWLAANVAIYRSRRTLTNPTPLPIRCVTLYTPTGVGPDGAALYVNGVLSPDVYLVRGRTYVFVVETGLGGNGVFQPVYFTTDSAGGYQGKSDYEKRVS